MITSIFDTCNIANLTSENDGLHGYYVVPRSTCQGAYRDGIGGAGSEHGWSQLRRAGHHEHARSAMVPTMSRWPPVGGHPAMVVAIEVCLGGTQERSAWEGGVKGVRLLFRRCLVALFSLLLASLSCAGFV